MTDPHTLLPLTHVMGWSAAALTLLTFLCQDMRRLRFAALAANAAFIAYASMASLWPVLVLHLILVPVNLWRLWQSLRLSLPTAGPPRRRRRISRRATSRAAGSIDDADEPLVVGPAIRQPRASGPWSHRLAYARAPGRWTRQGIAHG
jgi:hypothetical protein